MTYSSSSAADRLQAVREAIDRCLTAESYTVRGRQKISARLDSLMKLEQRLMDEVVAVSNTGMTTVGRYVSPE